MILEIILYFFLGFLAAVLLMLTVAPAIWNRAVVLTKRKVEGSLPLSLNEIQAEKDKLRAEYAMTTRRLELGIEDLQDKASRQLIELHEKRDDTNRFAQQKMEDEHKIARLEKAAEEMRSSLETHHEKVETLTTELTQKNTQYAELKEAFDSLKEVHSQTEEDFNKSRVDLVASESKVESLSGTLSTINLTDEERTLEIKKLNDRLGDLKQGLKDQVKQTKAAEVEARSVAKKLQRAEAKLEKLSDKSVKGTSLEETLRKEIADLSQQVTIENAKVVDLEARLAQVLLSNEIDAGKKSTKSQHALSDLAEENAAIADEIKKSANGKGPGAADKQRLKDSILNLAARSAAITAKSQPADSSINQTIEQAAPPAKKGGEISLLDRIKAIKDADTSAN